MRWLVALPLFLCPLLASGQQGDPRLQTVVPFDAKYLPLGDLGAQISKATNVKVTVDRAIADRKVAIFASDRPLGEIMARVAETMFLEWAVEGDGYRLQLNPDVAKEEREIANAETRLEEEGIRQSIRNAIAGSRMSLEAYRQAFRDASAEYDDSLRDKSEKGKKRSADLLLALRQRFPDRDRREPWDRGRALAQLGDAGIEAILKGQPYFASTKPINGLGRLPADAFALMKENGAEFKQESGDLLLAVSREPGSRSLVLQYRILNPTGGVLGRESRIEPLTSPEAVQELTKLRLVTRLNDWAKPKDAAVLKKALARPAEPPVPHPTNVMTQSDLLRWVHRKTGVPVVADAFRVAAGYANYPEAGTIDDYVKTLTPQSYEPLMPPAPYVRAEGGWLMMRHRRFWRRLRAELPERTIRPLERKAAQTPLTLDDYAGLVTGLNDEQLYTVARREDFVVDFPTFALKSLPAVRLWAGLPTGVRTAVQKGPIPVATLNGSALAAARAYVLDRLMTGYPDPSTLSALLPGGSGVPEGTTLHIRFEREGESIGEATNVKLYRYNEFGPPQFEPFAGWKFQIVGPEGFSLSQDVPLHPIPRVPGRFYPGIG